MAKVSVVGAGMRTHTGVAAQMFQSLAEAGVNIAMITTSEIKISVLVNRDHEAAVNAVHSGFRLHEETAVAPQIGYGNTGASRRRRAAAKSSATSSRNSRRWKTSSSAKSISTPTSPA